MQTMLAETRRISLLTVAVMKRRPRSKKPLYPEIAAKIKDARERLGLSQGEVAEALGHKNRQRYAHYEYGTALPKAADIEKLCRVLRLSQDVFAPSPAVSEVRESPVRYLDLHLEKLLSLWPHLDAANRNALLLSAENAVRAQGHSVEALYASKKQG